MAATGKKRRPGATASANEQSPASIAADVVRLVEHHGAVSTGDIKKRAPKAQLLAVYDALTSAGLEIGARFVRTPLEAQLAERVSADGPLPLRRLEARLRGASPREAATAASSLVERGRVRLVARGKELLLARHDASVLDARDRERLGTVAKEILAAVQLASRKGASLLRSDLTKSLTPFVGAPATPRAIGDVAALVDAHRESTGLTSVPKLVRLLGGEPAREALHSELLRGARAGRFELRPESGMGRLSVEDVAFCIPGPQGSRLSWVRRLEERS